MSEQWTSGCAPGRRALHSQGASFSGNPRAKSRMDDDVGQDVDVAFKQFFEILLQPHEAEQRSIVCYLDQ